MVKARTGEGRVKIVQGCIGQEFNESLTGCDNRWKHKAEFLAVCHWGFYFDLSIVLEALGSSYRQVNRIWKQWAPGRALMNTPAPFVSLSFRNHSSPGSVTLSWPKTPMRRERFQESWLFSPWNAKQTRKRTKPNLCWCCRNNISCSTPMGRNY